MVSSDQPRSFAQRGDNRIRQFRILSILWSGRSCCVDDFEEIRLEFDVIKKTIRRDLMILESVPLFEVYSFNHQGRVYWKSKRRLPIDEQVKPSKMKRCSRCGPKPVSEFWADSRMVDGLDNHCKECSRYYQRRWSKRHRAERNATNRAYRLRKKKELEQELG